MNRPAPLALDTSGGSDCFACVLNKCKSSDTYFCLNRQLHGGPDEIDMDPWVLDCTHASYREIP